MPHDGGGSARVRRIIGVAEEIMEYRSPADLWPTMDEAAYLGLAGDFVRAIEPHTEADPVAILIQYLAAVGSAIGRGPHYRVEGDRHGSNINGVLVGDTSKGRKGTSWGRVRQLIEGADPTWLGKCVHSGLSSGEGVIWAVRDPSRQHRDGKEEIHDPGIADKRLFVIEPEFAGVLAAQVRHGSILSRIIRDAWDRGDLATLTKNSPARATGAHVSIIGHITADELRAALDRVSMANGYANRFLWVLVRRARVLPFGGAVDQEIIRDLGFRTGQAIEAARRLGQVTMTDEARDAWAGVYPSLSEGEPGLLGAITGRAEAQTIRLALIYALLDGQAEIDVRHLFAALAVWEYAEASVRYIWGQAFGDPIADEILRALRKEGPSGMTRTQIRDVLSRNSSAHQIEQALAILERHDRAKRIMQHTGGRPAEVWTATSQGR